MSSEVLPSQRFEVTGRASRRVLVTSRHSLRSLFDEAWYQETRRHSELHNPSRFVELGKL
jgi:hypothetical protein